MKAILFLLLFAMQANAQDLFLKTYGVRINVTDMPKAIKFYRDILGFTIESGDENSKTVLLKPGTGSDKIILQKVHYLLPITEKEARATLTLQVNHLDSAIDNLKSRGLDFGSNNKRKEGVGYAIFFEDPFGTTLSMMHQTVVATPHFAEPKIYNYGFYVPDMDTAKIFFTSNLNFVVRSEKYLPLDLPLRHNDKSFAFMLHTRSDVEAIRYNTADNEHIVILFKTKELEKTIELLQQKGVKLVSKKPQQTPLGRLISFYDPFGYISDIIEVKNEEANK